MVTKTIMSKSENSGETAPSLLATETTATNKIKLSPSADEGSGSTTLILSTVSEKAKRRIADLKLAGFSGGMSSRSWTSRTSRR